MSTVTNISNITIGENTVIISLDRYNKLCIAEDKVKNNTVYTKTNFSWGNSKQDNVFTNSKAVKELTKDLLESRKYSLDIEKEKEVLLLQVQIQDTSWKRIFKLIQLKFKK